MTKKKILLTGFGKFNGVDDNPSSHLINEINIHLSTYNPKDLQFELVNTQVLEVSGRGVTEYLKDVEDKYLINLDDIILLHLGVASQSQNIALERFGWNKANFRTPDERGWSPVDQDIQPNEKRVNIETKLPLKTFVDNLSKRHKVFESEDPGRFICNYLYYLSLSKTLLKKDLHSLFVHIPPFEVIDKQSQLMFLVDLMNEISTTV
ncbi:hypothetical protein DLAC_04500 [Tieghemostelium lacteum]|uniref:Pyroglutamyl-peptidase I n=1 Tax=Tieghemostelium lacteum TaxID=361077 RepID=A0A151ZJT0_TIELA|nr:hypothetical protein DLAC_04500 [Tieghemostelium lacteum]|eukprot:KYQ94206.1 hypothetical protein DLAC_04500 [Tieghemostelium lacteum]